MESDNADGCQATILCALLMEANASCTAVAMLSVSVGTETDVFVLSDVIATNNGELSPKLEVFKVKRSKPSVSGSI